MEAADGEPGGHGHRRIETSLLPLKKRASNYISGAGRISAGDPYPSSSKKAKKRVDDDSVVGAETKETAGAFLEAPVPRQRRCPVPAAASREPAAEELPAPAAGSPEPAAKGKAALLSESDEEKKRLSKGKWLAKDESRSSLQVTPQPPVKKLMHDGIRSFIPHQLRADEHRRHTAAAVPPSHGGRSVSPALSAALERRLEKLGATRPWLVLSKTLQKSDVDANQNRLLVSCKRGSGTVGCPITRCFSPAELDRVHNKHAGLSVTAFDQDGFPAYDLTCKFLNSNNGYRFINEWKKFVTRNGMNLDDQRHKEWRRDVEVELWAFRSRKLPFQPLLDAEGKVVKLRDEHGKEVKIKDEDGKEVPVVQRITHHLDADGALGLLLLHHENMRRRVVVKSEEEEEDDDDWKQGPLLSLPSSSVACKKKKGKQQSGKRGASASASASRALVALPAPVAEQGGARSSEELLFCAALGLLKLRQSIAKQWQERVDRGGHGAAKSSADVEGEKTDKKQKSPGTHSIKELGANSQSVDSLGGNVSRGSGGRKTSTGHGTSEG